MEDTKKTRGKRRKGRKQNQAPSIYMGYHQPLLEEGCFPSFVFFFYKAPFQTLQQTAHQKSQDEIPFLGLHIINY